MSVEIHPFIVTRSIMLKIKSKQLISVETKVFHEMALCMKI